MIVLSCHEEEIMATQKRRKSSLLDFDTFEEYEKFAAKRNEATKRCRQKKDGELKVPIDIHSNTKITIN